MPLHDNRLRTAGPASWLLALAEPALLAVLLCYLLYQFLLSHVEGDQAYLLYAAQQMLHGVTLDGPTLIETNPPFIVWFCLLPAKLGMLLHVNAVLALRLVVLGMLAASAAWGWRLLQLSEVPAAIGRRLLRVLWAFTFLLVTVTQPAEFGQREQLLLALLLPYLLAAGSGVVARLSLWERVALGAGAGLAMCFKPQHLITLICLELFLAVVQRTLRRLWSAEVLTAVAVGLLYLGAVQLFTPAYFGTLVPLLRDTYWALGEYSPVQMAVGVGRTLTVVAIAAAAAWSLLRRRLALLQLEGALLSAGAGATLAYFQQHTGWYHQRFPAVVLLELGLAWMAADVARRALRQATAQRSLNRMAWLALPACGVLLFALVAAKKHRAPAPPDDMQAELLQLPVHTTVYAFSVGMNAFPALMERQLQWGSRFAHLWLVPAILANQAGASATPPAHVLAPARVEELAALQRRDTAQDLVRTRPTVIFVERCPLPDSCQAFRGPFNAVQWFSQDEEFRAAWSHYHLAKAVEGFDMYRSDAAATP